MKRLNCFCKFALIPLARWLMLSSPWKASERQERQKIVGQKCLKIPQFLSAGWLANLLLCCTAFISKSISWHPFFSAHIFLEDNVVFFFINWLHHTELGCLNLIKLSSSGRFSRIWKKIVCRYHNDNHINSEQLTFSMKKSFNLKVGNRLDS